MAKWKLKKGVGTDKTKFGFIQPGDIITCAEYELGTSRDKYDLIGEPDPIPSPPPVKVDSITIRRAVDRPGYNLMRPINDTPYDSFAEAEAEAAKIPIREVARARSSKDKYDVLEPINDLPVTFNEALEMAGKDVDYTQLEMEIASRKTDGAKPLLAYHSGGGWYDIIRPEAQTVCGRYQRSEIEKLGIEIVLQEDIFDIETDFESDEEDETE